MSFSTPLALLLLLALPYFIWLGWPRGRRRRQRDVAAVVVRTLLILLVVLGLAGTQAVRAADELAVVFLVDGSDSITPQQFAAAETYVRDAMATMGPADQAAVVVFGADALVERPMSGLAELAPVSTVPQGLHTDLGEAIRLGLALFPAGSGRRLVILSDGAATIGDAAGAAALAAESGVEIDYVPLDRPVGITEALISAVDAPGRVDQGAAFSLNVTVESTSAMPATLRVLAGGGVVTEQAVDLRVGSNSFTIRLLAGEQEFVRYAVELEPAADTYFQNNSLATFTEIVGPPRILVVAPDGTLNDRGEPVAAEAPQLILALRAAGLSVDTVTPAELPASLAQLSSYAAVTLVNVNAADLTTRKMETLQTYVRDLGGGLVVVGGPESYGMGGYFQTALEETLPVEMQIKDQERFPSVSIVIVIDRSGSMAQPEGGVTKIQLAAEGAVRVVELLNDFDDIAVIPVDTQPDNPIGPVSAADKDAIIGQIRQIGAGGGGIYVRNGLQAAADALAESDNQVKHIILLADGGDSEQKEGVEELIDSLTAQGVTVSTVSIGNGKDTPWLADMATRGDGRFHLTDRAANLPEIFTQETTAIQRTYLVEERFFPSLVSSSPILAGIEAVPPLFGYVGTSPKATAQVVLETHQGDPLLATWQYGLGRAVAWTSDATGRWAGSWVAWDGFPPFWAQTVRWSITEGRDSNIETVVDFSGEAATLTVDTRGSGGDYLNGLDLEARIVGPTGETVAAPLVQVAPGRYETAFTPQDAGAYYIRIAGGDGGDEEAVGQTSGWVLGYSPEYAAPEADAALLTTVAALTGGEDVSAEPAAVFDHTLDSERVTRPIWPWLLLAAVVLLPLDIGLRRLAITRRDWERAWAATFGRLRPAAAPVVVERTEQVSRLFQAKARAATRGEEDAPPAAATPPPVRRGDAVDESPAATPSRPAPPRPSPESSGDLAARLLRQKRARERRDDADSD